MVEVQAQAKVSQLLLMTNHELGKFLPLLLFLLSLVLLSRLLLVITILSFLVLSLYFLLINIFLRIFL